jgi:hypothetical protein
MGLLVLVPVNKRNVTILGKDFRGSVEIPVPPFAVAVGTKARCHAIESEGALAIDLNAPELNLFKLVEVREHALNVEHHVIFVKPEAWQGRESAPLPLTMISAESWYMYIEYID